MILLITSVLAGVLTVLAPCTISLLPVIVGGTLSGGSSLRRIVTVTASLGLSVILFTILLKASTALIAVPQSFWQGVSGAIIVLLGLAMIFPKLWDAIPGLTSVNKGSNKVLATGYQRQDVAGDVLTGAALGPVFSSCSPTYFLILATVLPRSLAEGFVYLLAYALGLCFALFVVAFAGQKLLERLGVASDPDGWLKRGIGVVFLILGVAIFLGYDKVAEAWAAERFYDVTKIEKVLLADRSALQVPGGSITSSSPAPEALAEATSTSASTTPRTQPPAKIDECPFLPPWWGDEAVHSSHRAVLLGKWKESTSATTDPIWWEWWGKLCLKWSEAPATRDAAGRWPYVWPEGMP